jgi:hypothetical protein
LADPVSGNWYQRNPRPLGTNSMYVDGLAARACARNARPLQPFVKCYRPRSVITFSDADLELCPPCRYSHVCCPQSRMIYSVPFSSELSPPLLPSSALNLKLDSSLGFVGIGSSPHTHARTSYLFQLSGLRWPRSNIGPTPEGRLLGVSQSRLHLRDTDVFVPIKETTRGLQPDTYHSVVHPSRRPLS